MSEQSSEARESPGGSAPLAREQAEKHRQMFPRFNAIDAAELEERCGAFAADWIQAVMQRDELAKQVARMEAERDQLRAAVDWAYQLTGALWPNLEALDNLSAIRAGQAPPHEWPVVPPTGAL